MTKEILKFRMSSALSAGAALVFCVVSANAQTTIYSDDFSGTGLSLNGTPVDVGGQNWQAGGAFLDNGTVSTVVGSAVGNAAFLPFTPVAGNIYTANATILNTFGDWVGFGFFSTLPVNGGNWTDTTFGQRHSNSGYAWILDRNNATNPDQQAFLGYGTGNAVSAVNGDLFDPNQPLNISIVLDTTAPAWTAEFILNGDSEGTVSFGSTGNPGIGGIGFSRTSNGSAGTGGTISVFSLTAVPEPSALALCGLGFAGLFFLVRRKKHAMA